MRPLSGKQKTLVVIGILLAPFVAVHAREMIFRYRAEQLLGDVRSLMVHRGTRTELQAMSDRWNSAPCTEQNCDLESDLSYSFLESASTGFPGLCLRVFRMFGGRLARVRAQALERAGGAWTIWFRVDVQNPSRRNFDGWDFEDMLSSVVTSVSRFSIESGWRGLTLHPDYIIRVRPPRSGDAPPLTMEVMFGPHSEPADIARLMTFDFSCLTRLTPCRKPDDIMPQAAAQFAREEPQLSQARKEHVCGPDIVGLMARNAEYASVVEMTGYLGEPVLGWGSVRIPRIRVIENIDPARRLKPGEGYGLEIFDANTDRLVTSLPADVGPGSHFVLLSQTGSGYRAVRAERCGIVPLNPANLELVKQAIAGNGPPAKP